MKGCDLTMAKQAVEVLANMLDARCQLLGMEQWTAKQCDILVLSYIVVVVAIH